jgi:hypothetical protein
VELDAGGLLGLVDDDLGSRLPSASRDRVDLVADEQRADEDVALVALAQLARVEHAGAQVSTLKPAAA